MKRLTLDDMIKALKCISSQDAEGDCYMDHENFKHMEDDKYKRIVCEIGENLRDYISGKEAVGCPYHQRTYGTCCEDGELYWLKDVAELLEELKSYKEAEEQGLLVRLPCKVGDIVYVDSTILPIEDMECYEDIDNKIPSYFQGRVISFRFAQRNWVKIAVKAKWLYEWIDDETGPESDYIECEKNFSILLSTIGKNIFLTREEVEKKLEEVQNDKT